jgi:hypothetical protein
VLGITAVAGMSGYLAMSGRLGNPDRRQRWLLRGMRPLILCGAAAVGLIIRFQVFPRGIHSLKLNETERLTFSTNEVAHPGSAPDTRRIEAGHQRARHKLDGDT